MEQAKIVLRADHIVKNFGGLKAIDDASLYLKDGEILGLIGPNGAGKTTMFNMISGTLPITSGTITVNGEVIAKPTANAMCKRGIGRTYQVVQPFSNLTVVENTMVGAFSNTNSTEVARREAMEVLKFLDLEKRQTYPARIWPSSIRSAWRWQGHLQQSHPFCYWMRLWQALTPPAASRS